MINFNKLFERSEIISNNRIEENYQTEQCKSFFKSAYSTDIHSHGKSIANLAFSDPKETGNCLKLKLKLKFFKWGNLDHLQSVDASFWAKLRKIDQGCPEMSLLDCLLESEKVNLR